MLRLNTTVNIDSCPLQIHNTENSSGISGEPARKKRACVKQKEE